MSEIKDSTKKKVKGTGVLVSEKDVLAWKQEIRLAMQYEKEHEAEWEKYEEEKK